MKMSLEKYPNQRLTEDRHFLICFLLQGLLTCLNLLVSLLVDFLVANLEFQLSIGGRGRSLDKVSLEETAHECLRLTEGPDNGVETLGEAVILVALCSGRLGLGPRRDGVLAELRVSDSVLETMTRLGH